MRSLPQLSLFGTIILVLLISACGQSVSGAGPSQSSNSSPCTKASSIRGKITKISRVPDKNGQILLDGTNEKDAEFDRVSVGIHNTTHFFKQQGNECISISFADLKDGQRLLIHSTGIVMESYPPQIVATDVVLLD